MLLTMVLLAVVCLAYANGANDNFKGVATLLGSRTTNYQRALSWGTACTALGSCASILLATRLLKSFSGKGLVSAELAGTAEYGAAVAFGAGLTVLLATRLGMPISTTHGLVGALVGAGWSAGAQVDYNHLAGGFFAPLIVSPLLAIGATGVVYPLFRWGRRRLGVDEASCVCLTEQAIATSPAGLDAVATTAMVAPAISFGSDQTCGLDVASGVVGASASGALDRLHYLSAGLVSFARGLNDTPKVAAILLFIPAVGGPGALMLVGLMMAAGGLISARRVAETMSDKITAMNHGQGFTANLITGVIVIGASRWGLPVSTTHVSCGALFGIGTVTGQAHWKTIATILLAWATTLPTGAALGALSYLLLARLV